ncbi:MAG: AI-2E family transporter [Candidatus Kapaibacterium sp.]
MAHTEDAPAPEESKLERENEQQAVDASSDAAKRQAKRPHVFLRRKLEPTERLALIGGFGMLALELVTTITPIINPIFPIAALIFFLYPFRRVVVPRRTIQLGIIIYLVWLFINLSGALFPFIVAFIVAYLMSPVVSFFAERKIPRWVTSLGVVLMILGVYTVIGFFLIPRLIDQFDQLIGSVQSIFKDANSFLDRNALIDRLASYGIPKKQAADLITNYVEPQLKGVISWIFVNLGSFIKNFQSVLEGVLNLVLIPIISFYLLIDFNRIRIFIRSTLLQDDPDSIYYIKQVDGILSSYLRGILLTSSLVGGMAIATLSAFGVPYAVVIGILTGVFNLIPTVGMFLNLGLSMVIYLFAPGDFWNNTLITVGMVVGLHALNSYVIEPRVIGDRVGLHPVLLIASLFIFAHFLGFIGLMIAVPTTAVMLFFLKEWYRRSTRDRRPVMVDPSPPGDAIGEIS